ncbi:MAG: hypothetical protein ACPHEQ_00780 [Arenicellales bacterium]
MGEEQNRSLLIEELEALGNLIKGESTDSRAGTHPTAPEATETTGITKETRPSALTDTAVESGPSGPETVDMFSSSSSEGHSAGYLDELVDELVSAIEKRLSMHSGESLPEPLRDALSEDIRARLTPWWSDQ